MLKTSKLFLYFNLFVFTLFAGSCSTVGLRLPAAISKKSYNPERVAKLKKAADNGVLFVINDHVFRDVEKIEVDLKCRKTEEPDWSDRLFDYLEVFSSKPNLYRKFHVIELRKNDKPGFAIQKDLDGLSYLSIQYRKFEVTEKVSSSSELPCDGLLSEYIDKTLTRVVIEWPKPSDLTNFLISENDRPVVERFNFDTRFINFLAERGAILKFSQELGFDKTADGKYVLLESLARLSDEVVQLEKSKSIEHINHWMNEISQKSIQGTGVQLFQITRDNELSHGIKVDSEGEFARRMLGQYDPTYLFLSYKTESGAIILPSLKQVNKCLAELTDTMGLGFSNRRPASEDRASFLRPGFQCRQNVSNP